MPADKTVVEERGLFSWLLVSWSCWVLVDSDVSWVLVDSVSEEEGLLVDSVSAEEGGFAASLTLPRFLACCNFARFRPQ